MTLDPALISFRGLEIEDLPLLYRWLNTDHVAQWYGVGNTHYPSYEQVVAHYSSHITGERKTDSYLIMYGDTPIGHIQTYFIRDYPEYAKAVRVDRDAAGVDIAIGEGDYVHRGLGSDILRRFRSEVVFSDSGPSCCILGPDPRNAAAIRAYVKAGFTYLKTVDVPGEPEPEYLMRIGRDDVIDISSDTPPRASTTPLL